MPERNAKFSEVLIGQMTEDGGIDIVLCKTIRILGHAEFFEPVCNLLLFVRLCVKPVLAEKLSAKCSPIAGRNNMDRDVPETRRRHAQHLSAEQSATTLNRISVRKPTVLLSTGCDPSFKTRLL